jgi:hypothetical protein
VKACRKPAVSDAMVFRDWIAEPITLQRGLTGAKPAAVCRWAFEVLGMTPDDELVDLYTGSSKDTPWPHLTSGPGEIGVSPGPAETLWRSRHAPV